MASEERNIQNIHSRHQVLPGALTQGIARSDSGSTPTTGSSSQATPETNALENSEQYLVFTLLDRECAIKAEHIQGVERLVDVTPVPNVAPWIRGVMNLRGAIVSVVDLRTFLEREQLLHTPRTRVLSLQYNEMVICFIVDGVSEMIPIPVTAILPAATASSGSFPVSSRRAAIPSWAVPYASGSATIEKRVIVLLDAVRLLFSDKIQHYEV